MIESTTMSASAAVQLSGPVRPFSLAKNRQMAMDSHSIFPSYSKTGSFPNGVAEEITNAFLLKEFHVNFTLNIVTYYSRHRPKSVDFLKIGCPLSY